MLQDLEAGKQLELDAIVTAVAELADITGAEAPTLRAVHAAADLLARTHEQVRQPQGPASVKAVSVAASPLPLNDAAALSAGRTRRSPCPTGRGHDYRGGPSALPL